MRPVPRTVGVLALCLSFATATKAADEPPPGPPEFEVALRDGSLVRVMPKDSTITVVTKYGKLTVPYAEVKKVELGFRYPVGVEGKVAAAIVNLGAASYPSREAAQKELLALGEYAVPAVRRAAASSDAEVARAAEAMMAKFTEKLPAEKLEAKDYDTIVTDEFTARGKIESPAVAVKTRYFGESQLQLVDTREWRGVGKKSDSTITLSGAKYARMGGQAWLDTGIDVSTDASLEIAATGQIDQWPQEPGVYMSGPGGNGAMVQMRGFGPGGRMQFRQYQSGILLGKVGANGEGFVVGAKYSQPKAPATGRLFVQIAPSHWGNDECSGEYKLVIKSGK